MDIEEYRAKHLNAPPPAVTVMGPTDGGKVEDAEKEAGAVVTRVTQKDSMSFGLSEHDYRGYKICQSKSTERWWVIDSNKTIVSRATDMEDAKNIVDYQIALKGGAK